MRALVVGASLWILGSSGCANFFSDCDAPDKPEYSCEPVAPGTPGSCGGPRFDNKAYDEDLAFPRGCEVRLPMCVDAHPEQVQTCTCDYPGNTVVEWSCPI